MIYLMDVSALVALLWTEHASHEAARMWAVGKKFALCPITEIGFLRVSSKGLQATLEQSRAVLSGFLKTENPVFIPANIRYFDGEPSPSPKKTTDWYLANLAKAHGMKWATFDKGANHPNAELIA